MLWVCLLCSTLCSCSQSQSEFVNTPVAAEPRATSIAPWRQKKPHFNIYWLYLHIFHLIMQKVDLTPGARFVFTPTYYRQVNRHKIWTGIYRQLILIHSFFGHHPASLILDGTTQEKSNSLTQVSSSLMSQNYFCLYGQVETGWKRRFLYRKYRGWRYYGDTRPHNASFKVICWAFMVKI